MKYKLRGNSRGNIPYIILYSVFWGILSIVIFSVFIFENKSLIRTADGLNQYYYSLVYYGNLLRDLFHNLFVEHIFSVPMWDLSIGYGSDILTTLNYYGVGDPLNLFTVFFTNENMELFFIASMFVRLYLAGLLFSVFSLSHNNSRLGTLVGSMIYVFSGFSLYLVLQYTAFANALLYLPLVLIGIDRALEKKKPLIFILGVFLSAITNFYLFYMITIFMVIYAVFRFIYLNRKKYDEINGFVWNACKSFGSFVVYYFIGLLLAMPIFLPVINVFLSQGRNDVSYSVPVFFEPILYLEILVKVFWGFHGNYMGYSALLLPVIIIVLCRKENRIYQFFILMIGFFIAIPFFSSAFNGFAYVTSRWYFGLGLAAAYLIAHFFEQIFQMIKYEKILVTVIMIILNILAVIISDHIYISILLTSLGIIIAVWWSTERTATIMKLVTVICSFISIICVSRTNYCTQNTNDSFLNYLRGGYAQKAYSTGILGEFENYIVEFPDVAIELSDQYRLAKREVYKMNEINSSLVSNMNGMQFYFSLYDGNIARFYDDLYINSLNDFKYYGVDNRSILLNLLNAKYLISENTQEETYGYEVMSNIETGSFQRNIRPLGLGYTYDNYSQYDDWDKLNAIERQYALLQTIFLDNKVDMPLNYTGIDLIEQNYKEVPISYSTIPENVIISENKWNVTEENTSITLSIPPEFRRMNSELYIVFEGLDFENESETNMRLCFSVGNKNNQLEYLNSNNTIYTNKHNYICNLGCANEDKEDIIINFEKAGVYTFNKCSLICQPLDDIDGYINHLYEDKLEQISIKDNVIKGEIELSENKILCLSVPYTSGFCSYVDGMKTEVYRANGMFMAIPLTPGKHVVEFRYRTPGLYEGCIGFLIGIICCVALCHKRNKDDFLL